MPRVQRSIVVKAPIDRVYQWWARWENLPAILPHVREVRRTSNLSMHWSAEAADGNTVEWDTALVQDLPQRQLAWEGRAAGTLHKGLVDFEPLSGNRTRLRVTISEAGEAPFRPGGSGILVQDLDAALERFRELIEANPVVVPGPTAYRSLFYKAMAATAGVLLIAGLAWSVVTLVEVWMIMLGALLLAATLEPAVAWLTRRRMPRGLAVTIAYLALLSGATILVLVLIPAVMTQGQELAGRLPDYAEQFQGLLARWHERHPLIPPGSQVMAYLAQQGSTMLGSAFSWTTRVIWLLIVALSILFLALFILLDGRRLMDTLLRLIPFSQKAQLPALARTLQERIGHYMLGLVVICLLAGVITWGALGAMGVPYALLIGALTAILQAIPFVGPLIGGGLAVSAGFSHSPQLALWTLIVYTVIQQLIGQFIFPLIMGRTLGIHPVWIALALLVGGTLHGLVGAFMAIPVAIAISIVLECYYFPWAEARASEDIPESAPLPRGDNRDALPPGWS
ncbi:MAG TPA: AI-2E family transporter [Oscillatoriaceae cyanobacterium]